MSSMLANWSIRKKLMFIIGLTIWVAMVIAAIAFISYDQRSAKQSLTSEATILTKVIAERSGAAVLFGDKKTAQSNLDTLSIHPSILNACLFDRQQTAMAQFTKSKQPLNCPQSQHDNSLNAVSYDVGSGLELTAPVLVKNNLVGTIRVAVSLESVKQRLWTFSGLAIVIQLIAGVLAYWLTYRLQESVVGPIQQLRDVTNQVSDQQNYGLRAKQHSNDEVGDLVSGFNDMLHTIQASHFQLQEAMQELDEKREQSLALAQSSESRRQQISDYFAGASHDLKQPLNAMGLYIEELRAQQYDVSGNTVSKLAQSMVNLEALLNELLDASKLEEGVKKPKLQPVCVKSLCERIAEEMTVLAQDKQLRFKLHLPKVPELLVDTDPLMLERIIRNLISNSIRYTDSGGVMLAVRQQLSSNQLSIEIWDTGIGIPSAKQNAIFESHVQLSNEEQDKNKGFGLGLSIVKRLTELLDYSLVMKSQEGQGTVFKIQMAIPERKPELELKANPESSTLCDAITPIDPLQGRKVLVVDDDMEILVALESLLDRWGMQAELADSYTSAKEYFESLVIEPSAFPDFVVSDFNLGSEETGLDVIALAKQSANGLPVKALIVTGETDSSIWDNIEQHGIPFLKKPLKPAKLRALMMNQLD